MIFQNKSSLCSIHSMGDYFCAMYSNFCRQIWFCFSFLLISCVLILHYKVAICSDLGRCHPTKHAEEQRDGRKSFCGLIYRKAWLSLRYYNHCLNLRGCPRWNDGGSICSRKEPMAPVAATFYMKASCRLIHSFPSLSLLDPEVCMLVGLTTRAALSIGGIWCDHTSCSQAAKHHRLLESFVSAIIAWLGMVHAPLIL